MLITILMVFVACFVLERWVPGWCLPAVRTWPLRVLAINAGQLGVVLRAGVSWERWLSSFSVFRLCDQVGPVAGGLVAYVIATFVFCWWHRLRHEVGWLWVGYVFQRPEMHRLHHQHGRHRNNYGDIVWWDMLFGTYENPASWDGRCGFDAQKEERLAEMLRYRDVHRG